MIPTPPNFSPSSQAPSTLTLMNRGRGKVHQRDEETGYAGGISDDWHFKNSANQATDLAATSAGFQSRHSIVDDF
ncbi:hypothetical protein ACFX12_013083 [Malus domestica]